MLILVVCFRDNKHLERRAEPIILLQKVFVEQDF
jgi:hypothetical protein